MKKKTIVQVRGTHGSGKSTVVRSLLAPQTSPDGRLQIAAQALRSDRGGQRPLGYVCMNGLTIVGSYETDCGGCDGITKQDEITARVREWSLHSDVVFEGILASKTYERYAALAREQISRGGRYVFAYLNTPLVECLKRVGARRFRRGEDKPLNPANVIAGYEAVAKVRQKTIDAGFEVVDLDWRAAEKQLAALLKGA
jgi:hypothetical protein